MVNGNQVWRRDVEQAEAAVQEVEVEEEALPPRRADHRTPLPIGESKAAAQLDRGEDAHEAVGDPVAVWRSLAGALVLAHGGLEVLARDDPRVSAISWECVREPLRLPEHEGLKLLEEHALVVEEILHPVRIAEGQMALEEQASKHESVPSCAACLAELRMASLPAVAVTAEMMPHPRARHAAVA